MQKLSLLFLLVCASLAFSQTYKESLLYSFQPGEGVSPASGLAIDVNGNLYGTTQFGGQFNCGTIFEVTPQGQETVLYSFDCALNGDEPDAGVTLDSTGNIYGVTHWGGTYDLGIAFKLDTSARFTVLHNFGGPCFGVIGCMGANGDPGSDGQQPISPIVLDASGNIYGSTSQGGLLTNACVDQGVVGCGTLFKLTPTGKETQLYAFLGVGANAETPQFNVLLDAQGDLHATAFGATSVGMFFELSPPRKYFALRQNTPPSYIAQNAAGDYFGTMGLFDLGKSVGMWRYSTSSKPIFREYVFCSGCTNGVTGGSPQGPLTVASNGIVYGTMEFGGSFFSSGKGGGVVFSLNPATAQHAVLYSFPNAGTTTTDGWYPLGGVIQDATGNLYGTLSQGGTFGQGAVFKLTLQQQ